MSVSDKNLVWLDLEMTGLNPEVNVIIEMAVVITDPNLNVLAEGPEIAINQSEQALSLMDEWNVNTHTSSGLVARVKDSSYTHQSTEQEMLQFIKKYVPYGVSPMCGNSIYQDRRFLIKYMPEFEAYFHYRNLDVSTLKILANLWSPNLSKGVKKGLNHRAMFDVYESIEELKYYREHFINLRS